MQNRASLCKKCVLVTRPGTPLRALSIRGLVPGPSRPAPLLLPLLEDGPDVAHPLGHRARHLWPHKGRAWELWHVCNEWPVVHDLVVLLSVHPLGRGLWAVHHCCRRCCCCCWDRLQEDPQAKWVAGVLYQSACPHRGAVPLDIINQSLWWTRRWYSFWGRNCGFLPG